MALTYPVVTAVQQNDCLSFATEAYAVRVPSGDSANKVLTIHLVFPASVVDWML